MARADGRLCRFSHRKGAPEILIEIHELRFRPAPMASTNRLRRPRRAAHSAMSEMAPRTTAIRL